MRTIATDDPGVCQSVTQAGYAKTAEQIDVLFGRRLLGPKKYCIRWGSPSSKARGGRSMRPLPNYFGHLLSGAFLLARGLRIRKTRTQVLTQSPGFRNPIVSALRGYRCHGARRRSAPGNHILAAPLSNIEHTSMTAPPSPRQWAV